MEARGEAEVHWTKSRNVKDSSGRSHNHTDYYKSSEHYFSVSNRLVGSASGTFITKLVYLSNYLKRKKLHENWRDIPLNFLLSITSYSSNKNSSNTIPTAWLKKKISSGDDNGTKSTKIHRLNPWITSRNP